MSTSLKKTLNEFALNKQLYQGEVHERIETSRYTAHKNIHNLKKQGYIKIIRQEESASKGMKKNIWGITVKGLTIDFLYDTRKNLDIIARLHGDKLLVFEKWEYFKQKGLGEEAKKLLQIGAAMFNLQLAVNRLPDEQKLDASALQDLFTHCFFASLLPSKAWDSIPRMGGIPPLSFNLKRWFEVLRADKDVRIRLMSFLRRRIAQDKNEIKQYKNEIKRDEEFLRNLES